MEDVGGLASEETYFRQIGVGIGLALGKETGRGITINETETGESPVVPLV